MNTVQYAPKSAVGTPLCPECETGTSAFRCDGVVIFKCGKCHGLWIAGGKRLGIFRHALDKFNFRELEIHLMNSMKLAQTVNEDVRALLVELRKLYGGAYAFRSWVRALRSLV